ncbi:MAG: SRPBCC family protein [Candidatus Thorarchaeota archaeon]
MKVEQSIEIKVSPETLWPLILKKENLLKWHPNAQEFDYIGERDSGVGAKFYMVGKSNGRPMKSVCEITEWQENQRLVFHEILGMTKKFETEFDIEPTETGSKLTIIWDTVMPYWIIGQIMLWMMSKQWVGMSEKMLENIKNLAET